MTVTSKPSLQDTMSESELKALRRVSNLRGALASSASG